MSTIKTPLELLADFKERLAFAHCYHIDHPKDLFENLFAECINCQSLSVKAIQLYLFDEEKNSYQFSFNVGGSSDVSNVAILPLENDRTIPVKRGSNVLACLVIDNNAVDNILFFKILSALISHPLYQWLKTKKIPVHKSFDQNFSSFKLRPKSIIGSSKAMGTVYSLMATVLSGNTSVLLLGESGVGKEKVAHELHYMGPRSNAPFISVNCAALPSELIESELFGHEKGAFTGASMQRIGRFEEADGGTLFLDEIGDLSLQSQVKLLRALQEKNITRLGSSKEISCNVRIIAATHQSLEKLIEAGRFRVDLYYRLNVFPIHIPPLRERKGDIILLANHFIQKFNLEHQKIINRISTSAIDMFMQYHWPGNVRELSNTIERAILLSDSKVIQAYHLPPSLQTSTSTDSAFNGELDQYLEQVEKGLIEDGLKSNTGHIGQTAKILGITERKLGLRMKKFSILAQQFK